MPRFIVGGEVGHPPWRLKLVQWRNLKAQRVRRAHSFATYANEWGTHRVVWGTRLRVSLNARKRRFLTVASFSRACYWFTTCFTDPELR
jgi:hypothetical protein